MDTTYNASDHHSICFTLQFGFKYVPPTRHWARAYWSKFREIMSDQDIYIPDTITDKKLDKLLQKLYNSISYALDQSCPLTTGHRRDPNQTWYTEWMQTLRDRVARHYSKQRRSPTPCNIELFQASQARYKKECR